VRHQKRSVLDKSVHDAVKAVVDIAESGKNIAGDFAKRVGMKPFTFKQYESAYRECNSLPCLGNL